MISFACPKCGKQHTARDQSAGRRGFCDCGAVMIVPGAEMADQNQAPKLIGQIDLHSAERHARYMKIAGGVVGIAAILAIACGLYFRNAWERENRSQLLTLKGQADALIQAKEYEKAKGKYDELFGLLGDRVVTDDHLKAEVESARLAVTENNKKVEPILAARAKAEQMRHEAEQRQEALVRASIAQNPPHPLGEMTYENYLKIADGMYEVDVNMLLGIFLPEEQSHAGGLRTLVWKGRNGEIVVCTFDHDHLTAKSQLGLK